MIGRLLARLRPAERRLALIAMAVIGCWVFVSVIVQPLLAHRAEVRQRIQTQSEKLDALHRVLAQSGDIEQAYSQIAPYLDGTEDEPAHGVFFSELESVARSANVTLNLKPRPAKSEGRISRLDIELDVEGSQADLLSFLDSILRMPKLVAIDRLRLSTTPAREGILRANLVLRKLSLLK